MIYACFMSFSSELVAVELQADSAVQGPAESFPQRRKLFVFVWVRCPNGSECLTIPRTELRLTRVHMMWG